MLFHVVNISHKTPAWIQAGILEYQKRFFRPFKLNYIDLPILKNADIQPDLIKEMEGKQLLSIVEKKSCVIALDLKGKPWSSENLSEKIQNWQHQHSECYFLIGGAYGLSESVLAHSKERWCLSNLTFPHQFVKLILAEQLYRATTIIQGHPYHK